MKLVVNDTYSEVLLSLEFHYTSVYATWHLLHLNDGIFEFKASKRGSDFNNYCARTRIYKAHPYLPTPLQCVAQALHSHSRIGESQAMTPLVSPKQNDTSAFAAEE